MLVVVAIIFVFTKLPVIQDHEGHVAGKNMFHAFKHKHLAWAVVAQFFYVGAQVSVLSLFVLYATKSSGISELSASDYSGVCGASFLIGRFLAPS